MVFSLLSGSTILWAQNKKIEVEKRIDRAVFPDQALEYLNQNFPGVEKWRLYEEQSSDSLSYEAKFKQEGYRYSVEFTPDGNLMDVEKQVKFRVLPESTKNQIVQRWQEDFSRFKIIKCQEQTSIIGIRYEIEVKGKNEKGVSIFEYLFEENGAFLKRSRVVLRSSDMTLY